MSGQTFADRCYQFLLKIPAGKVTTYKIVAAALGSKAYRAVGQAMKRNPNAPEVPCHRVVNSDGKIGGYRGGTRMKAALLKSEGLPIKRGRIENLANYIWPPAAKRQF